MSQSFEHDQSQHAAQNAIRTPPRPHDPRPEFQLQRANVGLLSRGGGAARALRRFGALGADDGGPL